MRATDLPSNVRLQPLLDDSFTYIDWQAPWLYHLNQLEYVSQAVYQRSQTQQTQILADRDQPIDIIATVLNTASKQQSEKLKTPLPTIKPTFDNQPHTLSFVSQNALPEGEGYEHFIATTGSIPTRDNLHDLFNGSIWLTFPKTKAVLNYYHMLEMSKHPDSKSASRGRVRDMTAVCAYSCNMSASRGRVRDTITVFDENGAILVTSNASIGKALIDFDWRGSLVAPRDCWDDPKQIHSDTNKNAQAAVYIFGHALLEQLVAPRKPLCAHSVVINVSQDFFALSTPERIACLDEALSAHMTRLLAQDDITPRHLSPLPILGVPHFWADNADPTFYEDRFVFRSGRQRNK